MNAQARLHNNPPDPLDDALAPYGDVITEAESWLDGSAVENEGQMKAVDSLLKSIKAAKKAVSDAEESEAKPIYDQWKAAKARFAPTITDLDRLTKGLVSIVDGFKRKLAAEKAEAERIAAQAAYAARKAAEEAARKADVADIEAQRAAAAAMAQADAANAAARAASADTVKGMRTVWKHEITDHRALLHWIASQDKPAVTRFIEEYARAHFKQGAMDGVRTWQEKEAF
jgi:Sec-independent protein translocase protein TatA